MKKLFILGALALLGLLLAAVISQAVDAALGPGPVDYARQQAQLAELQRDAARDAALAPVDLFVAAAWRLLPLLVVVAGLVYLAALGGAALARFRHERRPDGRGLLPVSAAEHDVGRAALASYHLASVEAARRPLVPQSLSYHHAPRLDYRADAGGAAVPPADELLPAPVAAPVPSFAQLLDGGRVGRGHPLLLGFDAESGSELAGDWRDLYATATAGLPGSGKTTSQRFFAAQTALHGARFVVCDPHAGAADDSLAATLAPLSSCYLVEPAESPREILAAVRYVAEIGQARVTGRDGDTTPIILWVDELTGLLGRSDVGDELAGLLELIAQEFRKRHVFLSASGQIWTAARATSELRDSLASVLCHRMKRSQARLLLPTEEAAAVERLATGEAILWRTSGQTTRVVIPNTTGADVARVGQLLVDGQASAGPSPRPIGFSAPAASAPAAQPRPSSGPASGLDGASASGRATIPLDAEAARILARFAAGATVHDLAAELAGDANPGTRRYKAARERVEALLRSLAEKGVAR